jgi:hypothetical protein
MADLSLVQASLSTSVLSSDTPFALNIEFAIDAEILFDGRPA